MVKDYYQGWGRFQVQQELARIISRSESFLQNASSGDRVRSDLMRARSIHQYQFHLTHKESETLAKAGEALISYTDDAYSKNLLHSFIADFWRISFKEDNDITSAQRSHQHYFEAYKLEGSKFQQNLAYASEMSFQIGDHFKDRSDHKKAEAWYWTGVNEILEASQTFDSIPYLTRKKLDKGFEISLFSLIFEPKDSKYDWDEAISRFNGLEKKLGIDFIVSEESNKAMEYDQSKNQARLDQLSVDPNALKNPEYIELFYKVQSI